MIRQWIERDLNGRHVRYVVLTALLAAAVAPALAEEARPVNFLPTPTFGLRLDRARLIPRVSNELESFAAFDLLSSPGTGLREHALFETMSDKIKHDGKRVTSRALRDQLVEMTGLDRAFSDDRPGGGPGRAARFTFGIHSLTPEVGVKYRVGSAAFRFHVDTSGELGLSLAGGGDTRSGISATFDGGDRYMIRARLGF
jgi:hypothetical protein